MLKVLELFGGIGACSKALEKLGIEYEIVDYVEIDKYAVASFNAIHGTNFEPQDIQTWNKDIDVDIIFHGSPCQDFSLAGKQAGGDEGTGTRSSLMYETIRIVEKLKPKYVLWENVKNLLSKKHKHNFDAYIERMEQLGYKSYYQVLDAKDYGIPQHRERVFTVSILNDYTDEKENISAKGNFEFPEKQELKLKLKDMLENEVDEKYYLSTDKIEKISHWKAYQKPFEKVQGNNSVVPTLTARGAGEDHSGMITYSDRLDNTTNLQEECLKIKSGAYARLYGSRGKIQNKDVCDTLTASMGTGGGNVPILKIKNATKKGYLEAHEGDGIDISSRMEYHRGTVQKGMIQTLDCQGGNNKGVVINSLYSDQEKKLFTEDGNIKRYVNSDIVDEFKEGQMATTSFPNGYGHGPRTHDESISLNTIDKPSVKQNLRIRKLTPKECWRLMGFDDSDYEKASKVNSTTQLYKQAGNSIVVNVVMEILKNLL